MSFVRAHEQYPVRDISRAPIPTARNFEDVEAV